jgi:hypothetical protein
MSAGGTSCEQALHAAPPVGIGRNPGTSERRYQEAGTMFASTAEDLRFDDDALDDTGLRRYTLQP